MWKFAGSRRPLVQRLVLIGTLAVTAGAGAQVVRDGSIGPSALVQPVGPNFVVDESMGRLVGSNLFHSFSRFDLSASQSATFTALSAVDNVLSRITGGAASFIDGDLVSNIANANLFLINPSGIVFGDNAAVNVDGSFHATTAHWLGFDSGERFEARVGGSVPAVTAARPEAFGFLGAPAGITLRGGEIEVADGADLSLVGGAVQVDAASLSASGGSVHIVAVGSGGEVAVASASGSEGFAALAPVQMGDGAEIEVSGDPAGSVLLRAQDLVIDGAAISATTEGATRGRSPAIDIAVRGTLVARGDTEIAASTEGAGRGGDVRLSASQIELSENAEVVSDTEGSAQAGEVWLNASSVTLSGDAELSSDVEAGASGRGGQVTIRTEQLSMLGDSEISTDTDPGSTGAGGRIDIQASRAVDLRIRTAPGEQAGIFSNSEGQGDAGSIRIVTPRLGMDGGVITAQTEGAGAGGNIDITAGEVLVTSGAAISALSEGAGNAGDIGIQVTSRLFVTEGGAVSARSSDSDGGNIALDAGLGQLVLRRGTLSANVNDGVGGNITIDAGAVVVDHSLIVAQAGAGRGGAIVINTSYFIEDESLISASAGPAGISGSVSINATDVELSNELKALASDYLDAAGILTARCADRRRGARGSSLTVAAMRAVPSTAEGLPLNAGGGTGTGTGEGQLTAASLAVLALSEQARDAVFAGRSAQALNLLHRSRERVREIVDEDEADYVSVHIAVGLGMVADADGAAHSSSLLAARELLDQAVERSRRRRSLRALSFALGNLAELYARQHRYAEALYLVRQALTAAREARAPEATYRWHWRAGGWLWAQGRGEEALAEYLRAVAVLDAARPLAMQEGEGAGAFARSLAPVYRDLVDALLQGADLIGTSAEAEALLVSALEVLERYRAAELRQFFQDECVAELREENVARGVVDPGVAVFHPVVLADRIELLLSVSGEIVRRSVPVSAEQLDFQVRSLRRALERPTSRMPHRAARRLHEWLVQPLRETLTAHGIHTLVVVPDGPLRGIPMAALHDGERYLIQDLALAVAPGLGLVDLRPIGEVDLQVVAAGLSEPVAGFEGLPGVRDEVTKVAASLDGEALLDRDFQLQRFRTTLLERRPNVVHIASHAQFGSTASASFILTHDGRLTLDALERYVAVGRTSEAPLELLVLSACETASGDERAALGLAGMAVRAGARSAVGSLWSISDEAAGQLVSSFYRELVGGGGGRADALRAAQLELLADPRYQHPFFWSPFLLINNWR